MNTQIPTMKDCADRQEGFRPIPVRAPQGRFGRIAFRLRCLVDLQIATIVAPLSKFLPQVSGRLLDVGCGERPYRHLLPRDVAYTGIDVPEASEFGMATHPDVVPFDGTTIPFVHNRYDVVLCTEVLEHCPEPARLIAEMHRVLRPGGTLVLTVPFAARIHHSPYDFLRFTPYALERMLDQFDQVEISARGNEITTIANKLLVLVITLARGIRRPVLDRIAAIFIAPLAAAFILAANLSMLGRPRATDDPLGFFVIARKPLKTCGSDGR